MTSQPRLLHFEDCRTSLVSGVERQRDTLTRLLDTIIVGDCLEVLQCLPDNSIDLIHTSPPYNISKSYADGSDFRPLELYKHFLSETIKQCKRILKPNGSMFWQTGYTQLPNGVGDDIHPIDLLTDEFFRGTPNPMALWDRIIWYYYGGMAFKRKFTNRHETILWYVKKDGTTAEPYFDVDQVRERSRELDVRNNFWGRNPGNVWEVDRVAFGSLDQTSHIAVFPEEISERIIRACTLPGALVLDPFSGSGTVPKVARSLSRHWIGIEVSPHYAHESLTRLQYQPPSETSVLTSGLLKEKVFGGRPGKLSITQAAARLQLWLNSIDVKHYREEFEDIVRDALGGPTKRQREKRTAWKLLDEKIARLRMKDPVVDADRILLGYYKYRRNWNGAMRYKAALEILEQLVDPLRDHCSSCDDLVRAAVHDESASFNLDGDVVALRQPRRKLKGANDGVDQVHPAMVPVQRSQTKRLPPEYEGALQLKLRV